MSLECNNTPPLSLTQNDFTLGTRVKGVKTINANLLKGIGTYNWVLDSDSLNIPSPNKFIISNTVDVETGNFIQNAMPYTAGLGQPSYRSYNATSDSFTAWQTLGNTEISPFEVANINHLSTTITLPIAKTVLLICDTNTSYIDCFVVSPNVNGQRLVVQATINESVTLKGNSRTLTGDYDRLLSSARVGDEAFEFIFKDGFWYPIGNYNAFIQN